MEETKIWEGVELGTYFQKLNELEKTRDSLTGLLALNKRLREVEEEKIRAFKEKFGTSRKERATKDEMLQVRATIRITLREYDEPASPMQVMIDAGLTDIDQVRRILREEAAIEGGPIKNIQDSKKDTRYYWDRQWRPTMPKFTP